MVLLLISFVAGILTALAPCVLPLLPVIVGGSVATGSNRRAYTIAISLGASVVLFTLVLKVSTALINVPQAFWNIFSGSILIIFGLVMVFPSLWDDLGFVNAMNRSSNRALAAGYQRNNLWGDIVMGAALGPVFSSCSPTYFVILATVLPASFAMGLIDLLAYAIGLSGFLLIIAIAGQKLVDHLGVAIEPRGWLRRGIGVLFVIVGLGVFTGVEASLEAWLLNNGFDATRLEQRLLGAPTGSAKTATTTAYMTSEEKALVYKKAPELVQPDGYINTGGQPITIGQFKGKKVVLIDIWTYSCINCQRTLPYIKAWYAKYKDQGLEIIGVHTPEFAFEHVYQNVAAAVQQFGIAYPVVLDNEYRTWNAFGNQFWPRKYLIDIDGYIVYDHAGEGNYDETEKAIQAALAERAHRLGTDMPATTTSRVQATTVDDTQLGSPETYFGAARNEFLADGTQGKIGQQVLEMTNSRYPNALYLSGTWNFAQEYASTVRAGARIAYIYKAKNVYFVASADTPVKIKVTRDGGQPLGAARGADVDANGEAVISTSRLYHLIGDSDYGVHTLEIEIESPGLQAYTFTFG